MDRQEKVKRTMKVSYRTLVPSVNCCSLNCNLVLHAILSSFFQMRKNGVSR